MSRIMKTSEATLCEDHEGERDRCFRSEIRERSVEALARWEVLRDKSR